MESEFTINITEAMAVLKDKKKYFALRDAVQDYKYVASGQQDLNWAFNKLELLKKLSEKFEIPSSSPYPREVDGDWDSIAGSLLNSGLLLYTSVTEKRGDKGQHTLPIVESYDGHIRALHDHIFALRRKAIAHSDLSSGAYRDKDYREDVVGMHFSKNFIKLKLHWERANFKEQVANDLKKLIDIAREILIGVEKTRSELMFREFHALKIEDVQRLARKFPLDEKRKSQGAPRTLRYPAIYSD